MAQSRIDLVNHSLPRAFRGYAVEETDRLIQDLADALAKASDEKVALYARLADVESKLLEFKQRDMAMQQTLVASQRMGEELRATAQKEAQLILEKAQVKAYGLIQNAQVRLAQLMEEVAEAKKAKTRFEAQIKSVIHDHLRLLELNRQQSASLESAVTKLAATNPAAQTAAIRGNGTSGA